MPIKIKQLPKTERPYEKLEKNGEDKLSDGELLAIIIKTGTKGANSLEIANQLLSKAGSIKGIGNISLEELKEIKGIGKVKAIQLKTIGEIARRIYSHKNGNILIKTPKDVYELLMPEYKLEKVEVIKLIILNSKNKIINLIDLARGEIDCANLSINNLMTEIFRLRAKKFILVHNHPSGDSEPSKQDYEITNRILEVSNLLGIKMLDHITIGDGNYTSIMGRLN
ncbi:dNA repair protein radc [Clostridium sp. CAG:793]|nr:dNA repair protein radc [Clostridium sp. CAG:793]